MLVAEDRADHIDLNFGCPVPKVTRRGGGAALPWKRDLLRAVLRAAVRAAGPVPVTMKMRMGIDDDHLTYLDAGRIAEDEGVAAVALHGADRRAGLLRAGRLVGGRPAQGARHLDPGARQRRRLGGRRRAADDGARPAATASSSAAAASAGPGCSGRSTGPSPGCPDDPQPTLGEVAAVMRRHAGLMAAWLGEDKGCREFRKHVSWYLKGFGGRRRDPAPAGPGVHARPSSTTCSPPWPPTSRSRRCRSARRAAGSARRAGSCCPEGWLAARSGGVVDADAELAVSGG